MKEAKWLKDCELCNAGVCKRIDELKEQGLSERAASRQMENECGGEQSANKILGRYKYHVKQQFGGGGTPTKMTDSEILSEAQEIIAVREVLLPKVERIREIIMSFVCPECHKDPSTCEAWNNVIGVDTILDHAVAHYRNGGEIMGSAKLNDE